VLAEARHRGCDHVFVTGRKRSPAGKAIFGDVAQRIVLEFDGAVTVLAE
jgi:nucleotide-binding universal stress UspA family protein